MSDDTSTERELEKSVLRKIKNYIKREWESNVESGKTEPKDDSDDESSLQEIISEYLQKRQEYIEDLGKKYFETWKKCVIKKSKFLQKSPPPKNEDILKFDNSVKDFISQDTTETYNDVKDTIKEYIKKLSEHNVKEKYKTTEEKEFQFIVDQAEVYFTSEMRKHKVRSIEEIEDIQDKIYNQLSSNEKKRSDVKDYYKIERQLSTVRANVNEIMFKEVSGVSDPDDKQFSTESWLSSMDVLTKDSNNYIENLRFKYQDEGIKWPRIPNLVNYLKAIPRSYTESESDKKLIDEYFDLYGGCEIDDYIWKQILTLRLDTSQMTMILAMTMINILFRYIKVIYEKLEIIKKTIDIGDMQLDKYLLSTTISAGDEFGVKIFQALPDFVETGLEGVFKRRYANIMAHQFLSSNYDQDAYSQNETCCSCAYYSKMTSADYQSLTSDYGNYDLYRALRTTELNIIDRVVSSDEISSYDEILSGFYEENMKDKGYTLTQANNLYLNYKKIYDGTGVEVQKIVDDGVQTLKSLHKKGKENSNDKFEDDQDHKGYKNDDSVKRESSSPSHFQKYLKELIDDQDDIEDYLKYYKFMTAEQVGSEYYSSMKDDVEKEIGGDFAIIETHITPTLSSED